VEMAFSILEVSIDQNLSHLMLEAHKTLENLVNIDTRTGIYIYIYIEKNKSEGEIIVAL